MRPCPRVTSPTRRRPNRGRRSGRSAAGLSKIRIRGDSAGGDESDLDPVSAAAMASQRVDTFASTLRLAEDLCGLSAKLSTVFPPEGRQGQLRAGSSRYPTDSCKATRRALG